MRRAHLSLPGCELIGQFTGKRNICHTLLEGLSYCRTPDMSNGYFPPLPTQTRRLGSGFSLVEMLTTIAVLGVMTSMALISIGNVNRNSVETRNRRNAQELAGICASAQAAGVDFVVANDLEQTIRNVVAGGAPTSGAFTGHYFGLPGLTPEDQTSAKTYLYLDNGSLGYRPHP